MDEDKLAKWITLGNRLSVAGPDKLDDVMERLVLVVEAQEIIAQFDDQLFLRGGRRPTKRYQA